MKKYILIVLIIGTSLIGYAQNFKKNIFEMQYGFLNYMKNDFENKTYSSNGSTLDYGIYYNRLVYVEKNDSLKLGTPNYFKIGIEINYRNSDIFGLKDGTMNVIQSYLQVPLNIETYKKLSRNLTFIHGFGFYFSFLNMQQCQMYNNVDTPVEYDNNFKLGDLMKFGAELNFGLGINSSKNETPFFKFGMKIQTDAFNIVKKNNAISNSYMNFGIYISMIF